MKTRKRPGSAAFTSRATASSASRSASLARRSGTVVAPARSRMPASAAAGSMRWSKAANSSVSGRLGTPSGCFATRRGGGVPKDHSAAAASVSPLALFVPAGTLTRYVVAIGKRPCGSKSSVRVPTQRHSPGTSGVSRAGTALARQLTVRGERDHRLRERDRELRGQRHLAVGRVAQHAQRPAGCAVGNRLARRRRERSGDRLSAAGRRQGVLALGEGLLRRLGGQCRQPLQQPLRVRVGAAARPKVERAEPASPRRCPRPRSGGTRMRDPSRPYSRQRSALPRHPPRARAPAQRRRAGRGERREHAREGRRKRGASRTSHVAWRIQPRAFVYSAASPRCVHLLVMIDRLR